MSKKCRIIFKKNTCLVGKKLTIIIVVSTKFLIYWNLWLFDCKLRVLCKIFIYWNIWLFDFRLWVLCKILKSIEIFDFECKLRVLCKNLQLFNWKWISVQSLQHYNEIKICVKFTSKSIFLGKSSFFVVISSIIPFNCYTYIAITLQSKQKLSTKILTAKLFLQWCNTYQ